MAETEGETGGVSRRDFLRRAGKTAAKEAVETGTRFVPGGAIVRHFLAGENASSEEENEAEPTVGNTLKKIIAKKGPLSWLSEWRAKKNTLPPQ